MATPLSAPTNVNAQTNGNKITVSWQDSNPAANVANYAISFLAKDTLTPLTDPVATADVGKTTVDIPRTAGATPSAADLGSKYIAQVVAKAKGTDVSDSAPGLEAYWDVNLSLNIKLGSRSLTLTKSSTVSGIYRLPVAVDDPLKITMDDVSNFAKSLSIDVPTKWPDGSPITGSLNVSKLAVDIDRKLFAMDISVTLPNFSPIPGLSIESVGLNLVRTDGIDSL
jgi:hypothetical protein